MARWNAPETDPVASPALTTAVATLNAALALKQAAATAATDAELTAAVAAVDAAIADVQDAVDALAGSGATDAELASAVGTLTAAIAALDVRLQAVESSSLVRVVNAGNMGAAYTLALLATDRDVIVNGTLNAAACTLTITGLGVGVSITFRLTQDATGSRLLTFPGTTRKPGGTLTLSTTPGALDVVTAFSPDGTTLDAFLAGQALSAPPPPSNGVAPAVTGTATPGNTLTSTTGTWTGSPTSYAYEWKRAGVAISGATASTHVVVAADVGQAITCTVTATNVNGSTAATSNTVTPSLSVPANTVAPAITGSAVTGQTLTCSTGTWTGSPAPTYSYQWVRNGTPIGGATASTRVLVLADEGTSLKCTVTATNASGAASADSNTVTPSSAPTAPGQPTGLSATPGNTQVVLAWTAPGSNGGSAITDYLVEKSPAGAGTWTTFADGTSASTGATVTGLTNGTAYDFRVSAINAVGTGSPSSTASATPFVTWTPADLPGIAAWYKADALSLSEADPVTSWPDSSGGGHDLAQASAGAQPTFRTDVLNGKPCVRFVGDDVMSVASFLPGNSASSDVAIFAVVKQVTSEQGTIVGTRDGATGWMIRHNSSTGSIFAHLGSTNAPITLTDSTVAHLVEILRDDLVTTPYVNGTAQSPFTHGTYVPSSRGLDVGSGWTGSAFAAYFTGDIYEIVICTTLPDTTNRDAMEAYVASKYGLTIA